MTTAGTWQHPLLVRHLMDSRATVRDRNGLQAVIVPEIVDPKRVMVELPNGRRVLVPRSALQWDDAHGYSVAFSFDGLEEVRGEEVGVAVPLFQEKLVLERQLEDRSTVRVEKRIEEREEEVRATATVNEVNIERIQVNEWVDEIPQVRNEGDTVVFPLVEEVLVVEKRLMLREEVRVTQVSREEPWSQRSTVRAEYLEVERLDGTPSSGRSWPPSAEDFVLFGRGAAEVPETAETPVMRKEVVSNEEVVPFPKPKVL